MDNQARDFKGIWIPVEVYLDERLNALDKIILMEIDSLDCTEEGCYASNEYLSKFCQCKETKVSLSIKKLVELGYLEVVKFDGRKRFLKSRLLKNKRQTFKKCKADFYNLKDINNNILKIDNNKKEIIKEKYFENEKVNTIFLEFLDLRKSIKAKNTERAIKVLINKLNKYDDETKYKMIEKSIVNSWKDVYELKEKKETFSEMLERKMSEDD